MFSYITRTQLRKPKTPQVMRHHDPAYTLYSDFIHCLAFSAKEKLCFLTRGPIPSHTFHLAVVPGPFAGEWLSSPSWSRQFSKARPVVLETVLPWGLSGASRAESGDTVLAGSHRCEAGGWFFSAHRPQGARDSGLSRYQCVNSDLLLKVMSARLYDHCSPLCH